jgi:Protein of unknown function (DUF3455)
MRTNRRVWSPWGFCHRTLWTALLITSICGAAETTAPASLDDIPADLRVEGPIIALVHAKGDQVYTCKADTTGKRVWILKAPDATFENDTGLKGKHYAGPTWKSSIDGSKVRGKIAAHAAPTSDAVPWLLLAAVSHEGNGIFSSATYIQRIHTTGGNAPAVDDAKEGDTLRVPYTADYVFYGPGATTQPAP